MKALEYLTATILSLSTLILAMPMTHSAPKANPIDHGTWSFGLYKGKHCAGEESRYSGTGSSGCQTDITSGAASGFIARPRDPHCTISFYKDKKCVHGHKIADIRSDSSTRCTSVKGRKNKIKSYEVVCL